MKELTEDIQCGDGTCKLAEHCNNFNGDECQVCMYNTGATTRDFYEGDLEGEDLSEYIEN